MLFKVNETALVKMNTTYGHPENLEIMEVME